VSTQTLPHPAPRRAGRVSAVLDRLRAAIRLRSEEPLYRNGYALAASSLLTSGLGVAYWIVAARLYSATAVGVSSALISSMFLLTNIGHLNLVSLLNRFLPRAGRDSRKFVVRSYLLALGATALASLIFVAGLDLWAPGLGLLRDQPAVALWFVVSTMVWVIFTLQDSVLAGIRQAVWVPAENLVFAIGKIVLLFGFVAAFPTLGVFVSWSLPSVLLVIPVTVLLFRRWIPIHVRRTRGREQRMGTWRIAHYASADYVAYLALSGTIGIMPLIVLGQLGAAQNAYYWVSWSIAYSLYLISHSMGMALLAEGSLAPAELRTHWRRTVVESARLVVPGAIVMALAAPLILGVMGGSYSAEAVTLLRLLALSAIPFIFVEAYADAQRVARRMRSVVLTFVALAVLVFALAIPLMDMWGIVGIGVAWLVALSVVAAAVTASQLAQLRRGAWRAGLARPPAAAGRGARD
jgi:O-antigen/teichoic acid export membrane protein